MNTSKDNQEPQGNNANRVLEGIYLEYGIKNKSPKGRFHCRVPKGIFQKWDIVENVGNTLTRGAKYAIVGYLKNADFYNVGLKNNDSSLDGYILVRNTAGIGFVETILPRDFLRGTGENLMRNPNAL